MEPESPCPLLTPAKPKQKNKLLSFLGDSCYLTPSSSGSLSTHHHVRSGSESGCYCKDGSELGHHSRSESELGHYSWSGSECESGLEESLVEQLSFHRLSTSSISSSASRESVHCAPPVSPLGGGSHPFFSPCSSGRRSEGCSSSFPQPTFSDCECSSGAPSPVHKAPGTSLLEERMEDSSVDELPTFRESLPSPTTFEDFEFNLAPVNQLSNFEPTPSEDPRLNLLSRKTRKENAYQTEGCVRKESPQLEQHGLRKVLQPLDNMQLSPQQLNFVPPANLKPVERRLVKGKQSVKQRRKKKARAN